GAEGWDADSVYPLYQRLETNEDPEPHHGSNGPVHIMNVPPDDKSGVNLLDAAEQAGLPRSRFNTGETVVDGAGFFQINRQADGTRASSSVSYLHPILDRENLTILTDTQVARIELDDKLRATGVHVVADIHGRTARIGVNREVVVSAGAIDSPKLLMLSGIGPADHLREVGIDVRVDSPGVGSNLQDHPEAVIRWESKQPMVRTSTQWWEIGLFHATEEGLDRPDLMMHYGTVPFDMHIARQGYPSAEDEFCL